MDGFEIEFRVFRPIGEASEFENVGITQDIGDALPGLLRPGALDDGSFVGGKSGAFVEQRADLPLKLADRPPSIQAFVFVEGPLPRIVEPDEFLKVSPGEAHQLFQGEGCRQFAGRRPANSLAGCS